MFNETLEDGTKRFAPLRPESVIDPVTDASFQREVLDAEGIVVVKFGAEWCGPCKMLAPALEKIAAEYQGKISVKDVDVDVSATTAAKYGVRGIPQLSAFVGGQNVLTSTGAKSVSQLRDLFERLIAAHGNK